MGHYEDAVCANEEEISLLRNLTETDPTFNHFLAQSLHNLGINLSDMGRHEDGVSAHEESANLFVSSRKQIPVSTTIWPVHFAALVRVSTVLAALKM
jgi:hypothetical protein